ncbi:hypothetical protein SCHPADRAFT_997705 [Schizopora paradoxa]|uniref:Uncharacterized protein n=1 Tax=Schizopora paradoxa TaxID=27342 RepID=A0A0H2RM05_9AGAM|nr:hypothetical protein SCHPADRAFT_997705 [Schizopora paradoxa]
MPRFRCASLEEEYLHDQKLAKEAAVAARKWREAERKRQEEEMNAPVEPKAIFALSNVLDRVLERKGDLNGQLEWVKNEIPYDAIIFDARPNQHRLGQANVKRARDALREMELANGLVAQLQKYLDAQLRTAREKVNALAVRTNFTSLPKSVLARVLVFSTSPDDRCSGYRVSDDMDAYKKALKLSHVCRLFRSLVFSNLKAGFWSTISEHMIDVEKIKFCVSRSGNSPIDVFLESWGLRQPEGQFEQFLKTCFLSSQNWNSFTFGEYADEYDELWSSDENLHSGKRRKDVVTNIQAIGRISAGAKLPKLKKLVTHFNKVLSPKCLLPKFNPFWFWKMPNLAELHISGCHPPPAGLSFASSLKTFAIISNANSAKPFEMNQLVNFLTSCKSLESVTLRFKHWPSPSSCQLRGIATICDSICFPKATHMNLSVGYIAIKEGEANDSPKHEAIVTRCLARHPLLEKLSFTFLQSEGTYPPILVPLPSLPLLRELHLNIECWADLKFWGDSKDPKTPSSVPKDLRLPPIRKLTCLSSDIYRSLDRISTWSVKFLEQLKKQGELGAFEKLDVCETAVWNRAPSVSKLNGAIFEYLPAEKVSTSWRYV